MSADREFSIKIATSADLAALTKTRTELEEMKRQAVAMGVSTGDLDKQITSLDSQIGALGKKTLPQATEGMTGFNTQGREFHRLAGELDRILPGVGTGMIGAFNPEIIGIAGFVILLDAIHRGINDCSEATKDFRKNFAELAEADLSGMVDGWNDAAASAREYKDIIDQTITAEEALKQSEEERLGLIHQQGEAVQKTLEAQEKLEIALAAGDKVKETQIREKYGDLKGQAALDTEHAALEENRFSRLDREGRQGILGTRLSDAKSARDAAKQREDELGKYTETKMAEDKAKIIQLQQDAHDYPIGTEGRARIDAQINKAQGDLQYHTKFREGLTDAADSTEQKFKDAKTDYDDNQKALNDLTTSWKEASAAFSIHKTTEAKVSQLVKETDLVSQLNQAIDIHQKQGEDMSSYVNALGKIMTNTHTTVMQKIALLQSQIASITHNAGTP